MPSDRYDRQVRMFGTDGQERLRTTHVVIVGAGGTGSHVIQQLAHLGVGSMVVIDPDVVELSNMNRLVGAHHRDHLEGIPKVEVARRHIQAINPSINIVTLQEDARSRAAFNQIKSADYVFGCVDTDAIRLYLTHLCNVNEIPYIDLATEVIPGDPIDFGGRVFMMKGGKGCLYCHDELSEDDIRAGLSTEPSKLDHQQLYGIDKEHLDGRSPSVISLNGIIASIAITEFLADRTGIREPLHMVRYHGRRGIMTMSTDVPQVDCPYCNDYRGRRDDRDVERYLKEKG